MLIQILRQVMISGEPALAGSILDLPLTAANLLLNSGKAAIAPAEAAPEPEVEAEPQPAPKAAKSRVKSTAQPSED